MSYPGMKPVLLLLVAFAPAANASASATGVSRILILDPAEGDSLARDFQRGWRSEARRGDTLALIRRLHSDLGRLSMAEQVMQLHVWIRLRSRISVGSFDDLLASEMMGALIADSMARSLARIEHSLGEAEGNRTVLVPSETKSMIAEMVKGLERNHGITLSIRPKVLTAIGETDDVEKAFAHIVEEAERRSQAAYEEKWGKNVIAIRRAGGQSLWPEGLQALCGQSAQTWSEIVNRPHSFRSRAYLVVADVYSERCMLAGRKLLVRIDKDHRQTRAADPVLRDQIAPESSFNTLRSSVMIATDAGGIGSRLALTDGK